MFSEVLKLLINDRDGKTRYVHIEFLRFYDCFKFEMIFPFSGWKSRIFVLQTSRV